MTRHRRAPTASRNAISRARTAVRDSIRFVTLMQAMSRRIPVAPKSSLTVALRSPTTCSRNGWATRTDVWFVTGSGPMSAAVRVSSF
jgi:hypothetical protein